MTTTLRPEQPEETTPDGSRRSRRWQICVNGRPVGGLRTTALRSGRGWSGEVSELAVDEGRRRGRATVGVLAAEEVLRGWGCGRVDVRVPGEAVAALRLAEVLGYTERMRNMAKRLGQLPQLPPGLTVRPLESDGFEQWRAASLADFEAELRASGLTAEQARAKVETDGARLLPQGAATPDNALRSLYDPAGTPVGTLWVALHQEARPEGGWLAWVMSVEVEQEQRGRGYGRALLQLAERECLAAGVGELGLNVFSGNAVATALYTSLGYEVTLRVLGKEL